MKLRIRGNSIRFRLTRSEVAEFSAEGAIEETVDFGNRATPNFCYALEQNSTKTLRATFDGEKITVSVPQVSAEQWINGEEAGIEGEDGDLRILIEKDFACLNPRSGEDETDNFPHPNLEKSC